MGVVKILALAAVLVFLVWCAERVYKWWQARRQVVREASRAPADYWQVRPLTRFAIDHDPEATSKMVTFKGGSLGVRRCEKSDGGEVVVEITLDDEVAAYAVSVNGRSL